MLRKLNAKKVALIAACLLLLAPATLAQAPGIAASPLCRDGRLYGVKIDAMKAGSYTLLMGDDICEGRTEANRFEKRVRKVS